jgi:hypothetical protein
MIILSSFYQEFLYTTLAFSFVFLSVPVFYIIKQYKNNNGEWQTLANNEI